MKAGSEKSVRGPVGKYVWRGTGDLVAPCTSIEGQKRSFDFLTDLTLHTFFVCIVLFCTYFWLCFLSEFYQTGQLSFMTQADSF